MDKETHLVAPGRPREFDTNQALDRAIRQFSAHGFHGTSISDLNKALGLTTGSIYKAWGDKRGLLLAALERYIELRTEEIARVTANTSDGLAKIAAVLRFYAELSSSTEGKIGCLVVEMAVELSVSEADIAKRLSRQESSRRAQFEGWVEEAVMDGSISQQTDIKSCAELLQALTQGMRVLGKTGASSERMLAIADQAVSMLASSN
ncbi:TetR/AcrR family transcriptional regulator [Serratia marcescens]|uniref:TetR/AcrR family transcriptional regulator n=1 Tax=Serratia marcescens TaxID=615 RepID=UPI001EF0B909|nr:TetR/AcrR family transcriptional regulator [Serratia marcescens]ULH10042.1 TetR/AcrR family transcriptional regulator [Serratia marcescens]